MIFQFEKHCILSQEKTNDKWLHTAQVKDFAKHFFKLKTEKLKWYRYDITYYKWRELEHNTTWSASSGLYSVNAFGPAFIPPYDTASTAKWLTLVMVPVRNPCANDNPHNHFRIQKKIIRLDIYDNELRIINGIN